LPLPELRLTAPPALFPVPSPPAALPIAGSVRELARAALDRGAAEEALIRLRPVLDAAGPAVERHDPVLHFYQALALEMADRWVEAEAPLRRALYLDRSFTLAHYHLALLAERRGDAAQAARSLENAGAALARAATGGDDAALHMLTEVGGITAEEMAEAIRIRQAALQHRPAAGGQRG